jgi:hypothetical protein
MRRSCLLPLVAAALTTTAAHADTIRFDFSGLVETASARLDLPGAIDAGPEGATAYTATAIFDTDAAVSVDTFGSAVFADALISFEASFGAAGSVSLNQSADVRQSGFSGTVSTNFGTAGTLISPAVDALDGAIQGREALFGNFRLSSFPGEPDFFTDADELLSGVVDVLTFDRTSFNSFELSLAPDGSGSARAFVIADIGSGTFTRIDDITPPPPPAPIPLPASGLLLLGALGLMGIRRKG